MALFGTVGVLITIGVQRYVDEWCQRDTVRRCHGWMMEQADQLRRGEIDCLVNPVPAFVEELLADTACAAKVRELYLGGDLSDPRLGRLRDLPNLKCVVFLFADNQNALLERLRGTSGIEKLTFDNTRLSRSDIEHIGGFPNLKSLALDARGLYAADLQGLSGHQSIERLAIQRVSSDNGLIPLLKSLPRLRDFSIGASNKERDALQTLLNQTLPLCKSHVSEDDR
ncbi:MAG: hypothetical protein WCB27_15540 [Thermoguttaceae bacterium]